MKRTAESAQIESDDVAALSVRKMGDSAISVRKTRMDDFKAFLSRSCHQHLIYLRGLDSAPKHTYDLAEI
jgi:hypothetical protein